MIGEPQRKNTRFSIQTLPSSFRLPEERLIGIDTFLNRKCIIKSYGDKIKFWYWNNLVLKKEFAEGDVIKTLEYAISVDENYVIKADEFDIPKDVTMKNINKPN